MSDPLDRRTRDARIRELHEMGWSNAQIGAEVSLSGPRVSQILASPDPDVALFLREAKLRAELDDRQRHAEANRHRIRVLQRTLDRIAEERESRAIDRLLGLTGEPGS